MHFVYSRVYFTEVLLLVFQSFGLILLHICVIDNNGIQGVNDIARKIHNNGCFQRHFFEEHESEILHKRQIRSHDTERTTSYNIFSVVHLPSKSRSLSYLKKYRRNIVTTTGNSINSIRINKQLSQLNCNLNLSNGNVMFKDIISNRHSEPQDIFENPNKNRDVKVRGFSKQCDVVWLPPYDGKTFVTAKVAHHLRNEPPVDKLSAINESAYNDKLESKSNRMFLYILTSNNPKYIQNDVTVTDWPLKIDLKNNVEIKNNSRRDIHKIHLRTVNISSVDNKPNSQSCQHTVSDVENVKDSSSVASSSTKPSKIVGKLNANSTGYRKDVSDTYDVVPTRYMKVYKVETPSRFRPRYTNVWSYPKTKHDSTTSRKLSGSDIRQLKNNDFSTVLLTNKTMYSTIETPTELEKSKSANDLIDTVQSKSLYGTATVQWMGHTCNNATENPNTLATIKSLSTLNWDKVGDVGNRECMCHLSVDDKRCGTKETTIDSYTKKTHITCLYIDKHVNNHSITSNNPSTKKCDCVMQSTEVCGCPQQLHVPSWPGELAEDVSDKFNPFQNESFEMNNTKTGYSLMRNLNLETNTRAYLETIDNETDSDLLVRLTSEPNEVSMTNNETQLLDNFVNATETPLNQCEEEELAEERNGSFHKGDNNSTENADYSDWMPHLKTRITRKVWTPHPAAKARAKIKWKPHDITDNEKDAWTPHIRSAPRKRALGC